MEPGETVHMAKTAVLMLAAHWSPPGSFEKTPHLAPTALDSDLTALGGAQEICTSLRTRLRLSGRREQATDYKPGVKP